MGKSKAIKILFIAAVAFFVFVAGASVVIPIVQKQRNKGAEVTGIRAENDREYGKDDEILASDFDVYKVYDNGNEERVDGDYSISTDKVSPVGKTTSVTVTYDGMEYKVKVKNERRQILTVKCGNPDIDNVKATLYSNGELEFTGTGNVLTFSDFPWKDYEEMDDYPVESISFADGVAPLSMDDWFSGISTLTYVHNLPDAVESMVGTFADSDALVEAPDWSNCTSLRDVSNCYEGCDAMESIPAIGASVTTAQYMAADCTAMSDTPDMTGAASLTDATGMYSGCSGLTVTSALPGCLEVMSSMYTGCINLSTMPEIPDSVTYMDNAFEDDVSLRAMTSIPAGVENVAQCFSGCTKLEGMLWVDGEPTEYTGFMDGVATATEVDLQGNSRMMDVLANTCETGHVTVDGKTADPNSVSREDVIAESDGDGE